jgi:hypothetical protein
MLNSLHYCSVYQAGSRGWPVVRGGVLVPKTRMICVISLCGKVYIGNAATVARMAAESSVVPSPVAPKSRTFSKLPSKGSPSRPSLPCQKAETCFGSKVVPTPTLAPARTFLRLKQRGDGELLLVIEDRADYAQNLPNEGRRQGQCLRLY